MQVRQRLWINWVVPAVSALAVIIILLWAVAKVQRALEATAAADDLLTAQFERLILRTDMERTGNERSRTQWKAKHAQIGILLEEAPRVFPAPEDRGVIRELTELQASIGKLTTAIEASRARPSEPGRDREIVRQMEARLLSQLNMKVYQTILLNSRLDVSAQEAVSSSLKAAAAGVLLMLLIIAAVTLANSFTMNRAFTAEIARLRRGAAVIGGGDLEQRIEETGDEEFVELAQAFNEMTDKLRASHQSLEREIEERRKAEAELREATEAAEAANRTKSQFLANMSHELRTPMSGVLGMLELALQSPMDPGQQECLERALKAGRSLLRIINDILDLSKVERGNLALVAKPFDLKRCVSETVGMLAPEAQRKGLELKIILADDLPARVVGDQVRVRQILLNLTGNAVKFTEHGQVEIRVEVEEARKESAAVRFTVSDTGIGVPQDKRHLLFQYFSQLDTSNTRGYGGTGLGLAISKALVEQMGGSMALESEEGNGSTFSFTISLGIADEAAQAEGEELEPALPFRVVPPSAEPARAVRLLVAEDDATIREVLGGMLTMLKFEVDFAEDGEKAVQMWREQHYDLILMDVQMPKLDGFDATRAIRELEKQRGGHLPIIAMTAHAMKEDQDRCLKAGMDRYVPKPIDFRKCIETIKELLPAGAGLD